MPIMSHFALARQGSYSVRVAATAWEIAYAVLSDESVYVTAQTLAVDPRYGLARAYRACDRARQIRWSSEMFPGP